MAYALIPEGYTIKQVSKAQKDAIDEHFGRERKGTYIEGLVSIPYTPLVAAGLGIVVATPLLIDLLLKRIEALELPGVNLPTAEDLIIIKKEAAESLPAQVIETLVSQSGFLSFIGLSSDKKAGTAILEELGL